MAGIPVKENNLVDVDTILGIASKITDAASSNTAKVSDIPGAVVDSGTSKVVQGQTATNISGTENAALKAQSGTTANNQIVTAAQKGLGELQSEQAAKTETPISTPVTGSINKGYLTELYNNNNKFLEYAKAQGFNVYDWMGKLFVNNTAVDWQSLGLSKDTAGNYTGSQAQYDQLLSNVKNAGYTSSQAFADYAKSAGYTIAQNASKQYTVNGKVVDFSQYTALGMKVVNGAWVGTEEAYKQIIKDVEARSDKSLVNYLKEKGFSVQTVNNQLYINNKLVDWKTAGLKKVFTDIVGADTQYEQIANQITQEGYSNQTLTDYLKNKNLTLETSPNSSIVSIGGQLFDLSQYQALGLGNISQVGWGGTEEAYNKIVEDLAARSQVTFDTFVKQSGLSFQTVGDSFYLNNRKLTKADLGNYGIQVINGKMYGTEAGFGQAVAETLSAGYTSNADFISYAKTNGVTNLTGVDLSQFGMAKVNGQWVGSETQYMEAVNWVKTKSQYNLGDYLNKQSSGTSKISSFGKLYINGKLVSNDYAKTFGIKVMGGQLIGSEEQYNDLLNAVRQEGYTTNLSAADYLKKTGTFEAAGNNYKVNGKLVSLANYEQYGLQLVDGNWVGPESAYTKIAEDVAAKSSYTFDDWMTRSGLTYEIDKNGKILVNGNDVTTLVNNAGLESINGELVGTDAQYRAALAKIEEPYTYKSALEEEIQNALDELNNFQVYQTPQETLDLVNQLITSAQEKFNYVPGEDSALIIAQKEAQRQVREGAGTRGLLYSSGTLETSTRKMAELIPQFEQAAYARFQQEQQRTMNVLNAVMQWDQYQADRNMDQLTILTNKFNVLLDMDSRGLEQFKVLLDQRNADKLYAMELQKFNLDKKTQEVNSAWDKVNQLGYVDEETSVILGVPVGTKASWVKQLEEQQKNDLANQQTQYANDLKLQQSQQAIDKSLVEYKAALDDASAQKLAATENEYNKQLAQQQANNAIALANGTATAGAASSQPTLKNGSSGASVKTLQSALNKFGYGLSVDGAFGPKTLAAVKAFQKSKGLAVDGIVGPKTWAALLA